MKHIFSSTTDKMKSAKRFSSRTCIRRPEPTVRASALLDITSKLQMPEVDVQLPQSKGNGSPPTSEFCITTKSVEWSVRADVAKHSFLFPQSSHARVQIVPCWREGVSLFTGRPVFA